MAQVFDEMRNRGLNAPLMIAVILCVGIFQFIINIVPNFLSRIVIALPFMVIFFGLLSHYMNMQNPNRRSTA